MQFKYRAFDKRDNKMHEVFGLTALPSVCYVENSTFDPVYERVTDEIIIMRGTGQPDGNGKEIFEGDLLTGAAYHGEMFYVEWTGNHFGVGFSISCMDGAVVDFEVEDEDSWKCLTVIGNLYENPELKPEFL